MNAWDLPEWPIPAPEGLKLHDVKARPIPGTEQPGQTGHYINTVFANELIGVNSRPNFPKTCLDAFEHGRLRSPDGPFVGRRHWNYKAGDWDKHFSWLTYNQVAERRDHVGSALCHLAETAFQPSQARWTVGLWSLNREEWQIANQATAAYDLVNTSLYETLGPGTVEYILNHANVHVVFSAASHIPELLSLTAKCPDLKVIVSMDNFEEMDVPNGGPAVGALPKAQVLQAWAQEKGVLLFDMQQLEQLGKAHRIAHKPPHHKSTVSICYTSGTTGNPKGVILSHELLVSAAIAHAHGLPEYPTDGCHLIFLPLSHIFARACEIVAVIGGARIAYPVGDNLRLLEDFQISKPFASVAVPRVLNRIYAAIAAQTVDAPGLRGALSRRAFAAKIANFKRDGSIHHPVWDPLLMNKIKMLLGGNLRHMGVGGAPLSQKVSEFLQVSLQFNIIEGYGATETGGNTAKMTVADIPLAGWIGAPQVSQMIKLVDVPELGYFVTDKPHPRGEIYCRGYSVSTGYFKNEETTREVFDNDGWFKTGDVGLVDECGRFRIIDRVKNLVKLAQGEYVAVEAVENVYSAVSLAQQVFIYADSLQSHLILFVVPEPEPFSNFASSILKKRISPTDSGAIEEACQNPKVIEAALKVFNKEAVQNKLQGFERAKQLAFKAKPFTEQEGSLTPTMKIKRNVATKILQEQANTLFDEFDKGSRSAKM